MGYILVKALMQPEVCPRVEPAPLGEALRALKALILPFLLIAAVLGSIYTGFATPTESAAVGSVGALAILAVDGNLRWSVVREAAVLSVRTTCMIALMMVGTQIISTSLSVLQIPAQISAYFAALAVEPWVIAVLVGLFYIVLGCLIEGTSMFFLTFPVIYPLMMSIGFDPIWFGVMMALFIEASLITPPVGLNLFIIQQVSDEPSLGPVIKGSLPFCVVIIAVMGLFIAFPELVLYLPSKL
jgi:tripartite ATP-independent transporter DctM subunit